MSKVGLINKIITSIRLQPEQSGKQAILEKYLNEVPLRKILNIIYNPWIDLKLQDFQTKHMGKEFGMGMSQFMHIFDEIIQGKFDRREAEFACRMALMHINCDDAEIFLGIIHQDLGLGLEISTINAAWPGFIADYPIRLASPGSIETFDKFPASIQPLSRGLRFNAIVTGPDVSFRDKTGKTIDNWDVYKAQFNTLAQGQTTVFDGHAYVVDKDGNIVETDNEKVLAANPEDVRFVLWDTIRYDGFIVGEDTRIGYNWRYNGIEHMMILAFDKNPQPACYTMLRAELVGSIEQLKEAVTRFDNGCVIKPLDSTWKQGKVVDEIIYENIK